MAGRNRPTLILLCGLPGSGKTTVARRLADEAPAVRLCPDEWMAQLGIDLFDEQTRDRLERLFWQLAQDLLRLGQSVILESGSGCARTGTRSASAHVPSVLRLSCTTWTCRSTS